MLVLYLFSFSFVLALGAPLLTLPSLALIDLSHNNATFPSPIPPSPSSKQVESRSYSRSRTYTFSHLPQSPYYYTTPDTPITLKFYSYGLSLPCPDVIIILNTALRDVNAQLHPQDLITRRMLSYWSGKVYVVVHQNGQMTWEVFEKTLWGLMHFVEDYDCVDFDFDVGEFGMEKAFGTGALGDFK